MLILQMVQCLAQEGLLEAEVAGEYELNTGKVIIEEFVKRGIKAEECPAVLVHRHGPFTWERTLFKAVENALILEEVSKMVSRTERIAAMSENSNIGIEQYLLDKHYQRKHGKNAYYGRNKMKGNGEGRYPIRKHNKTYDSCQ